MYRRSRFAQCVTLYELCGVPIPAISKNNPNNNPNTRKMQYIEYIERERERERGRKRERGRERERERASKEKRQIGIHRGVSQQAC